MIEKERAFEILEAVLSNSKSDMTEAVIEMERMSLTRFAESKIHQNIDREETILYIRAVKDNKIGVIATGDISNEGIKKAVADCEAMHLYMTPDEKFISFPGASETLLTENIISEGTASFGPAERAEAVKKIGMIGRKGNLEASGAYRIEQNNIAVANSFGVRRYFTGNNARLSLTLSGKENLKASGWAMGFNLDASKINASQLALTAVRKAMQSKNAVSLLDGKYTVILEPAAVGQLLLMLSFMGFGGKTFSQHRSFMSGKIGEKIAGENFTVYEDPLDKSFGFMPFDFEGVTRRKVALIENGIARGVVYNSYYANLMDTESTGNALPATNSYGPYPKTLVVTGGDTDIESMIKSTKKGILITHFWYLNFLNPMRTMITGTTVDGTFLIENGEIGKAVKNMRTNQSILEAFSNIEMITKDRIIYPQFSVLMKVPGMKINNFDLVTEEEDESKC